MAVLEEGCFVLLALCLAPDCVYEHVYLFWLSGETCSVYHKYLFLGCVKSVESYAQCEARLIQDAVDIAAQPQPICHENTRPDGTHGRVDSRRLLPRPTRLHNAGYRGIESSRSQ
jgi:hypothetical protein